MRVAIIGRVDDSAFGNVGDCLIREGVERLLEAAFGCCEFWPLSKFEVPTGKKQQQIWRELINAADLCVVAGTPQWNNLSDWRFPYDDVLYTDILFETETPLFLLGGGAGGPMTSPDGFASHLAKCPRTFVLSKRKVRRSRITTVRDPHASAWLERACGKATDRYNYLLRPCPSVFASVGPMSVDPSLLILSPGQTWRTVLEWYRVWENVAARHRGRVLWVCHTGADLVRLRQAIPNIDLEDVVLAADSAALLEAYHGGVVVSSRLHGALAAWSVGSPAVLVGVDIRMSTASVLSIPTIDGDDLTAEKVMDILQEIEPPEADRDAMLDDEIELLHRALDEHEWHEPVRDTASA